MYIYIYIPIHIYTYSTQLSTDIRLVPGNVVMVATDMCGKSPHHWERRVSSGGGVDTWNYGKHAFLTFFLTFLFIILFFYCQFIILLRFYYYLFDTLFNKVFKSLGENFSW